MNSSPSTGDLYTAIATPDRATISANAVTSTPTRQITRLGPGGAPSVGALQLRGEASVNSPSTPYTRAYTSWFSCACLLDYNLCL